MARIDPEATIKRANELASKAASAGMEANTNSEAFHGALNLLRVVHGPNSIQEKQLVASMAAADRAKDGARCTISASSLPLQSKEQCEHLPPMSRRA